MGRRCAPPGPLRAFGERIRARKGSQAGRLSRSRASSRSWPGSCLPRARTTPTPDRRWCGRSCAGQRSTPGRRGFPKRLTEGTRISASVAEARGRASDLVEHAEIAYRRTDRRLAAPQRGRARAPARHRGAHLPPVLFRSAAGFSPRTCALARRLPAPASECRKARRCSPPGRLDFHPSSEALLPQPADFEGFSLRRNARPLLPRSGERGPEGTRLPLSGGCP